MCQYLVAAARTSGVQRREVLSSGATVELSILHLYFSAFPLDSAQCLTGTKLLVFFLKNRSFPSISCYTDLLCFSDWRFSLRGPAACSTGRRCSCVSPTLGLRSGTASTAGRRRGSRYRVRPTDDRCRTTGHHISQRTPAAIFSNRSVQESLFNFFNQLA